MADKIYISKPGGAVLQMKGGATDIFVYGQEIPLDAVSDSQKNHLSHISTSHRPDDAPLPHEYQNRAKSADLESAMIEAGSVNSTASAVPGNYGELSAEEAVRLVQSVRDHKVQAALIAYEIAHENRGKVIKAGTKAAQDEAEIRAIVAAHEAESLNTAGELPRGATKKKVEAAAEAESVPSVATGGTTPPPTSES